MYAVFEKNVASDGRAKIFLYFNLLLSPLQVSGLHRSYRFS